MRHKSFKNRQFLPGLRARVVGRGRQGHWQGGPAYHDGATCPVCVRPLLLLWDLNCADARFVVEGRPVFKNLKRLPLYFCMICLGDLDYQVTSPKSVKVFGSEGIDQGEDFPYPGFPMALKRQPLDLDLLQEMSEGFKTLANTKGWIDPLLPNEKKILAKAIGHPVERGWDIWWHQLGGIPWLVQVDPEANTCPNLDCSCSRRGWRMKMLAVIRNDPPGGLPMIETMAEVKRRRGSFDNMFEIDFYICKGCLSIHACNRCD